jgi:hypothetical protein
MTSAVQLEIDPSQIDPSLRDMSFADVNPALTSTSQDSSHGNSIPGGEPVHRSALFFSPKP